MPNRTSCTTLLLAALALAAPSAAPAGASTDAAAIPNPAIDAPGYLRLAGEAIELRESRRLGEAEFARRAAEPGTVVLDARSRDRYELLHLKGAVSLPFTDFTVESLRRVVPDRSTPILIYCNNNFAGAEEPFPTKAPPAALNLSTFVALVTYGYRNVWELGPLVEVATTRLELVGAPIVAGSSPRAHAVQ